MSSLPIKPKTSDVKKNLLEKTHRNLNSRIFDKLWDSFLNEMLTLYYPPFRAWDEGELLEQTSIGLKAYIDDLKEFDVHTLENGWRSIRRQHKSLRWPTIQEIRSSCLSLQKGKSSSSIITDPNVDLWKKHLAQILGKTIYQHWIRPLSLHNIFHDTAYISAPNSMHAQWCKKHYESYLLSILKKQHPSLNYLHFQTESYNKEVSYSAKESHAW